MHKIRRYAHAYAWYDKDGEPLNRNPFKKIRPRRRRSNIDQVERGLLPVKTEGNVRSSIETRWRREMNEGVGGIDRAETLPPASASTDRTRTRGDSGEDRELSQQPTQIEERINVSQDATVGNDQAPRRRKFMDLFKSGQSDESTWSTTETEKSKPGKSTFTVASQLRATIFNSWVNVLLIAAPVGIALGAIGADSKAVFVVNFIAIIPLAAMLSFATEEISLRTGETIGGLLNASFGNAVELIVGILALVKDQIIIVQTSLIGSMLSNLLLVLGMCFFFGGLNRMEQKFNVVVAQTAASLLALAVGSLIIPTAFHTWSGAGNSGIAEISRGTSIILLVVYGCYLFFQLKSHVDIYNAPSEKTEKRHKEGGDASKNLATIGKSLAGVAGQNAHEATLAELEEEEEPQLHIWVAVFTLLAATALVAACAEFLVGAIDSITTTGSLSKTFVGLILLPIVGNAAEHATAVTVAVKDKMDLAIGVAVGSSMQIALLILPLIVVIGWISGHNDMTLYFDGFQITILFVAVLLVNYLISDGKSHWLEGVLLMDLYLIIAVAGWFYPAKGQ